MSSNTEVKVPDIGDFTDVEIVEVLVSNGDSIQAEDSLISLETDKATMEVPSPSAGVVDALKVKVGDKVSEGSLILTLRAEQSEAKGKPSEGAPAQSGKDAEDQPKAAKTTASEQAPKSSGDDKVRAEVLVLGSGPGGYSAAFRAADLGKRVVLIERYPDLGGVCLNVGCIPSKALLHVAHVIDQAQFLADHGVAFGTPKIALDPLRKWKTSVVTKLTGGIRQLAKQRKVTVIQGRGAFTGPNTLEATDENGKTQTIGFDSAIVATGSRAIMLPFLPTDDARVMDSTDALELAEIPNKLLVLGGGIIGLEMANVFCGLGAKVDVVEMLPQLLSGVDRDMVKPLDKRMRARCANVWLQTQVTDVKATKKGLTAHFDGDDTPKSKTYDRVLVAVGRHPNSDGIGAEAAGVNVDDNGFVPIDKQMRTNVGHIFAIGDVARQPLLAHKAVHEGKVAAEVAAGEKSAFEARSIPSVVYTDPEVAWTGVTEDEAKAQGLNYGKGSFPWAANGRALGMGADNGVTKILFDADTGRAIGGAAVGAGAGDLIVEIGLAIEMGADAQDIGLTIHPHPTLSETVGMSAEAYAGTITDLYIPRKSERKS